jgi:hypothetical protein
VTLRMNSAYTKALAEAEQALEVARDRVRAVYGAALAFESKTDGLDPVRAAARGLLRPLREEMVAVGAGVWLPERAHSGALVLMLVERLLDGDVTPVPVPATHVLARRHLDHADDLKVTTAPDPAAPGGVLAVVGCGTCGWSESFNQDGAE